jgi:hypothetical protein
MPTQGNADPRGGDLRHGQIPRRGRTLIPGQRDHLEPMRAVTAGARHRGGTVLGTIVHDDDLVRFWFVESGSNSGRNRRFRIEARDNEGDPCIGPGRPHSSCPSSLWDLGHLGPEVLETVASPAMQARAARSHHALARSREPCRSWPMAHVMLPKTGSTVCLGLAGFGSFDFQSCPVSQDARIR